MNVLYTQRRLRVLIRRYRNETLKTAAFAMFLFVWMLVSVVFAVSSIDRFILATEMNTNGLVEYLCLGTGCERLTAMDW